MKSFNIPGFYKSPVIQRIKEKRKELDPRKQDFSPTLLDFGPVRFFIARHFGFCYGVENAIEISYKAVEENPGKRIFLISQMIHNPEVNKDLQERGIRFLMDTEGNELVKWDELKKEDVVIVPAFGTTLAIEKKIKDIGLDVQKYNTTCPFVERVWSKSEKLGKDKYTILVHGKHNHEETRATFSRSEIHAPSIIIKDIKEARKLGEVILGKRSRQAFHEIFGTESSPGFDPDKDLTRVGVINQTTMLASETQEIADFFRNIMKEKYGEGSLKDHFADTRDTLCYATNENQQATYALLKEKADLAIVVGGYNSSNTSHIVELCEKQLPTFYISSERELISEEEIHHFDFHHQQHIISKNYLPSKKPVTIILTSGASCPDAIVENVLQRILSFFEKTKKTEEAMEEFFARN